MTRFLVLSTQRSGSTWAVDMLDSHPEVACYGELLLPEARGINRVGAQDLPPLGDVLHAGGREPGRLARHVVAWRYLDGLYAEGRAPAVGFKLMYAQLRPYPWVAAYAVARRVRIVHFIRANKLDQVLSELFARATRQYHVRPDEAVAVETISVDPAEVVARIGVEERRAAAARRAVALLPVPSVEVAYERLVEEPREFERLLAWLGVDPGTPLTTRLARIAADGYAARIENRDELRRALAGTPYADRV